MIIAITGHRPQHLQEYHRAEQHIKKFFREQFELLKPDAVVSGMALGVDQWAAQVALGCGVTLTAAIPFKVQAKRWTPTKASNIEIICKDPISRWDAIGYLQKRNEWMVDNSGYLLGVHISGQKGGTYNCIKYAKKKKRNGLILNPISWITTIL